VTVIECGAGTRIGARPGRRETACAPTADWGIALGGSAAALRSAAAGS